MNTQIPISRRLLLGGLSGSVAVAALASANVSAADSGDDLNGRTKLLQFPADRGRLGHSIFGSGPEAVLVMHEWLGDHRNYLNVLPYLTVEKYTYVFADLRGYGLSKDLVGAYSAAEASADAFALMQALGHKTFHVAGHSMSGMIGQRMLLDDIGAIKSLTLTSPVPANGFKVDPKGMEALRSAIYDDAAAKAAINARTGQRYSNAWLDRKLWIVRTSATPAAMEGYLAMFTGTDFSTSVRGAKMRVGAIVGAYDVPAYRVENVTKTLTDLYGAVPVSVDNEAGHYSMLETPVLYASLLEKHISAEV